MVDSRQSVVSPLRTRRSKLTALGGSTIAARWRVRFLYLLTLLYLAPSPIFAQGGFTTVTGTITGAADGVVWSCGSISAQLITAGGAGATLNGGGFTTQTSPVGLGCPTSPGSGANGSFAMRLADSGVINPSNTTWKFTVNMTPGIAPPAGTGPQSFTFTTAINCSTNTPSTCTSNQMDISAQLSALAPRLSNSGAGGSAFPVTTPVAINSGGSITVNSGGSITTAGTGQILASNGVTQVATLPATCTVGGANAVVQLTSTGQIFYCSAPNTFTPDNVTPGAGFPVPPLAWYRCMPGDTVASLRDYSGNGNNATGTTGTAPTIIAGTGGCNFTGNGNIVLPTALNGALTVMAMIGSQGATSCPNAGNQHEGLINGNGNGANANFTGLFLANEVGYGTFATGSQPVCVGPLDFSSAGSTTAHTLLHGINVVALVMAASDHIYFNQSEVCTDAAVESVCPGGPASAGVNTFPFVLGGTASGPFAANTFFTGQGYEYVLLPTALTAAQVAQTYKVLTNDAINRGIGVGAYSTAATRQIAHVGDSLTDGGASLGANGYYPSNMVLDQTWNTFNNGISGSSLKYWTTNASGVLQTAPVLSTTILGQAASQPSSNLITLWLGTNDCANNNYATGDPIDQLWGGFARDFKLMPSLLVPQTNTSFRPVQPDILVATMVSRTQAVCGGGSCDPCKNVINPVIRQHWRDMHYDGLIDIAMNAALGADGAAANTTYFADTVHPTENGELNIVTLVFQRAINGHYAPQDFSSAVTYASAAPAAVTITAASETGNTMTFTSASGAPPIGTCAFVTGVTPAGYNTPTDQCWNVLTSNGSTSWTAWNNTTGLGAGTVFGTFTFPLQKDHDVFQTLNFGAGNYTLEPCWMWAGQNVNIKNINAVASTIVPWSTETIDGAATVSVASKATLVLQSILVSTSAAGCTWKQLQNN